METPHPSSALRVTACTLVTRAELPQARVLAASYGEHHPAHLFLVIVVDDFEDAVTSGSTEVNLRWFDRPLDQLLGLATRFDRRDFLEALIPLALRQLLAEADVALLLDPCVRVYASFADVTESAARDGLVVLPRTYGALPLDDREPTDSWVAGQGNLWNGFLAVGRTGIPFLDRWNERVARTPMAGAAAHLNWFDRIPGSYPARIVEDKRLGVAHWNLHERDLGEGVSFVAFDGYDPAKPWLLSARWGTSPRTLLSRHPHLRALSDAYRNELIAAGSSESRPAYGFARMADGSRITAPMRAAARRASLSADPPEHPFGTDAGEKFRQWLVTPATREERATGLNRLVIELWHGRPDLRAAYPKPMSEDSAECRKWCRSKAARRDVPKWAAPVEPPTGTEPNDTFGANFAGFLGAEVGIGEMSRALHRALVGSSVPFRLVSDDAYLESLPNAVVTTAGEEPIHPLSILSVNYDHIHGFSTGHPSLTRGRYRIGVWAWELDVFPETLRGAFDHVDEVWTISEFCAGAFRAATDKPVKVFPLPITVPAEVSRPSRAPDDPVTFLFCFDFLSSGTRKNPWAVVEAFRQAFPERPNARLVLKTSGGTHYMEQRERLRWLVADDPRIELIERYLSIEDLAALYNGCDAYISLHRSEGFGLTLAEAMARGLPVIATDYSSTTEFVLPGTGWQIPFELVEVGVGAAPYPVDARWAEPDVAAAAQAMREVADDPTEAQRRGEAARRHIAESRTVTAATAWVEAELAAAYAVWKRAGGATGVRASSAAPGSPSGQRIGRQVSLPVRASRRFRRTLSTLMSRTNWRTRRSGHSARGASSKRVSGGKH